MFLLKITDDYNDIDKYSFNFTYQWYHFSSKGVKNFLLNYKEEYL